MYSFVGSLEQKIVATEDLPTSTDVILSASFDKDGEEAPSVATGILSLYSGKKKVGEGWIKIQPGEFRRPYDLGVCQRGSQADVACPICVVQIGRNEEPR